MTKHSIKGDGNIIGHNNFQVFHKTTSNVSQELVALIAKLAISKDEEKELENDLKIVQDENQSVAKKTSAAGRIAKWLKTASGEAGKIILQKMVESGIDWAEHVAAAADLIS